jgi:hypothetical protein
MHTQSEHDGLRHADRVNVRQMLPARHETRTERVHEIRRRIADDAYRSGAVAEEIARRILLSRDL